MAAFNPGVPETQDPNFMGYSRAVSAREIDFGSDKSKGELLSAGGNLLGDSLKVADFTVKNIIEDDLHAKIDAERNKYTATLDDAYATVSTPGTGPTAPAAPAINSAGSNLLSPDAAKPPTELTRLPQAVATLESARANNKLSETAYYGRLDALAKDFRSRYPGYRDYIDQNIEKITGVNPANAYVKGMIQDINTFQAAALAEKNKIDSMLLEEAKKGVPGINSIYEGWKAGRVTANDAVKFVAQSNQAEWQFKYNKLALDDLKGTDEVKAIAAHKVVSSRAADVVSQTLNALMVSSGNGDPVKLVDLIEGAKTGKYILTDEQAVGIGKILDGAKLGITRQLTAEMNTVSAVTGKTAADHLGGQDKVNKVIADNLGLVDQFAKGIHDKDAGLAGYAANAAQARAGDALYQLVNDPKGGGVVTLMTALNKAGGPQFASEFYKSVLTSQIPQADKDSIVALSSKLMTQSTPYQIYTVKNAVDDAKRAGVVNPSVLNSVVNIPTRIADPKTPDNVKANIAKATYDPSNTGVIARLPEDAVDPNTGRPIPGKYSTFMKWTSPEVTDQMWKMGQSDPTQWDNYKKWVGNTFGNELFNRDIKNLNVIATMPDVVLGWDSDKHQIVFTTKRDANTTGREYFGGEAESISRYVSPGNQADLEQARKTVFQLNIGLRAVSNVYSHEGLDVNAYTVNLLRGLGADSPEITDRLLKAIEASRKVNKQ